MQRKYGPREIQTPTTIIPNGLIVVSRIKFRNRIKNIIHLLDLKLCKNDDDIMNFSIQREPTITDK